MGDDRLDETDGGDLEQSSILANPRHRRILSVLRDRSNPVAEHELSVEIAAREGGTVPSDVPEEDYQPVRTDLHHRSLPKLEAIGWIERHPGGITAAESLPFGGEGSPLPDLQDPQDLSWEAVGVLLARPRRQDIVAILVDKHRPLTLEELATKLAEHSHPSGATWGRGDDPELLEKLHHVDLPQLTEVGLTEYDPEERTVTRTGSLLTLANRINLSTGLLDAIDPD